MFFLICILAMWLMIFGVACFYFGSLNNQLSSEVIYRFVLSVLVASIAWLFGAYFLVFENSFETILSVQEISLDKILNLLFQLCFCLYAVIMLIGSVIDRIKVSHMLIIVAAWIFLVYSPLAYLIWNRNGFLSQMGVLDFSGGMVVHLSAGVSTYALAYCLGKTPYEHSETNDEWLFLGMMFVTLGWFGFNAGPVGKLNQVTGIVLINTLLAIICGGLTWSFSSYRASKKYDTSSLLNGMIVGLVTSTAGVGFVNPLQMIIITSLSTFLTYYFTSWINNKFSIDDVVDSFGMNGIGGLFGSLGVILFFPQIIGIQLFAIVITIILSALVTFILGKIFS